MAQIQHFDTASFDAAVKGDLPVLVDFWATWCGPCRMLGPIVDQLADEYEGRVVVGKVDVDQAADLAARFGISSVPSVKLFKGGVDVASMVGAAPNSALAKMIDNNI